MILTNKKLGKSKNSINKTKARDDRKCFVFCLIFNFQFTSTGKTKFSLKTAYKLPNECIDFRFEQCAVAHLGCLCMFKLRPVYKGLSIFHLIEHSGLFMGLTECTVIHLIPLLKLKLRHSYFLVCKFFFNEMPFLFLKLSFTFQNQ